MCYAKPGPRCSTHVLRQIDYNDERLAEVRERMASEEPQHTRRAAEYRRTEQRLLQRGRELDADFARTPEGLREAGIRYESLGKEGARLYAAFKRSREDALYEANELRREAYGWSQMSLPALKKELADMPPVEPEDSTSDAPESKKKRVTPDSKRERLANHIAYREAKESGAITRKPTPRDEWAEKYTYREELQGASTNDLHAKAVEVLTGKRAGDEHLLTCIVEKKNTNTQTIRAIARSSRNLETRRKAVEVLATRLMRSRDQQIHKDRSIDVLQPGSTIPAARVSDFDHTNAVHTACLIVAQRKQYREVRDEMQSRIDHAVKTERHTVKRLSQAQAEALAQSA